MVSEKKASPCPQCGGVLALDDTEVHIGGRGQVRDIRATVTCEACGYRATLQTTIEYASCHYAVPTSQETVINIPVVRSRSRAGLALCANPHCRAVILGLPRAYGAGRDGKGPFYIELCPQCYQVLRYCLKCGQMQLGRGQSKETGSAHRTETDGVGF